MNGWKLVPIEPTEEMLSAADAVAEDWPQQHWEAMLAAAPVPPAGDVEVLTNKQIRAKRYAEDQAFHSWAFNKQGAAIGRMNGQVAGLEAWHARGEIADAEVTRLTAERDGLLAEVARLKEERDGIGGLIEKLNAMTYARDLAHRSHMREQSELTKARELLGGMLFAFDDGVGHDWSAPLLDEARKFCPAVEFKGAHNADESCGQDAEAAKGEQV